MTFDPDRPHINDPVRDDPIRRRMQDGEGIGFLPTVLGIALLIAFGAFLVTTWNSSGTSTTRESSVRTERQVTPPAPSVTPAPPPKAPN